MQISLLPSLDTLSFGCTQQLDFLPPLPVISLLSALVTQSSGMMQVPLTGDLRLLHQAPSFSLQCRRHTRVLDLIMEVLHPGHSSFASWPLQLMFHGWEATPNCVPTKHHLLRPGLIWHLPWNLAASADPATLIIVTQLCIMTHFMHWQFRPLGLSRPFMRNVDTDRVCWCLCWRHEAA